MLDRRQERRNWRMRGATGLWIGLVVVAINGLVFGIDLHGFLGAAAGSGRSFPVWQAIVLVGACVYLLVAGILFDRERRGRR